MPNDSHTVRDLVRHHRMRWPALAVDDAQLVEELDFINDMLLQDEAAYRAASRAGRGFALRETERSYVWALYEAVTQALNAAGLQLWSALPRGACLAVYGENVNRVALYAQLCRRLGRGNVWWINERGQKKRPPQGHDREYLRMAYADTATGLEASIVFLIGMEPLFAYESIAGRADEEQRERLETNARKLYMAMTRAGQQLFVVSSQRLPAGMQALFDEG